MRAVLLILAALVAVSNPLCLRAQEWTRFRGPNGSGLGTATAIPSQWTEKDFNWKLALPGPGHSSPVLWGDRVFVTDGDAQTNLLWLICADAVRGAVLWQKSFPLTVYSKNNLNSVASGSPAVDERRVYLCWTTPEHFNVAGFAHDGAMKWERDLGPYKTQHGGGISPMVWRELVIVANQQDGESFVTALDAATGETRWKTPRRTTEAAYATPCVYEPAGGKAQLVFASHSHGISALDPQTGRELWEYAEAFEKRVVSSPLVAAGLILGSCGSGEGGAALVAVRPGDAEAGRKPELAYRIRKAAPYVPTSLCVGHLLFLWADDGAVSCVEAATGGVKWQERLGKRFFSSPVFADGRIFCVSTTGEVVVIRAADKFELLARNPLNETTHSTPAIAGGRMYLHTTKHLISIGNGSRPAEQGAP